MCQVLHTHSDSETGRSYLREGEERRKRGWWGEYRGTESISGVGGERVERGRGTNEMEWVFNWPVFVFCTILISTIIIMSSLESYHCGQFCSYTVKQKAFAFFAVSEPSAKVFCVKFCEIRNVHVVCMRVCCACARATPT